MPLFTDSSGHVTVTVFENFDGYLTIEHDDAVPYRFYLQDGPLKTMEDYALAMVSRVSFGDFFQVFQIPPDETKGALAFRVFDCRPNTPAANVRFTLEPADPEREFMGLRWYFEGGLPNTTVDVTNESGLGGFVGLAPALYVLTAVLVAEDGNPQNDVVITKTSVDVRPGWMAAGYLRPDTAAED